MWRAAALLVVLAGDAALADAVVPVRTIRANTVLSAADVAVNTNLDGGSVSRVEDVVGLETRVVLYAGRPIQPNDISEPAVVTRNQMVPLIYESGGLSIETIGRALDRGAAGELVRVMNLASRSTLFGLVHADGSVRVDGR